MSRKDYELIASAFKTARPDMSRNDDSRTQWARGLHVLADGLARDNPRFDRSRFYAACGAD